jgi:DNA-binding response OmpR family regulator
MVVDDEPDVLTAFRAALEAAGFEVDTYTDAVDALAAFKPGNYALLILDIRMPKLDGFELYDRIQKIDGKAKVCFITAYEINYQALREIFASPDEACFIKKPVDMEVLVKRVNTEIG